MAISLIAEKLVDIHLSNSMEMGGNPSAKNKIRWLSI
jgi:hypothetical protein